MPPINNLVRLTKIPKIFDDCYLCFVQPPDHIPFLIKRVYYIIQPDPKLPRGFHAHKKTQQMIFCIQGSIRLVLDDGQRKEELVLDQPDVGVLVDKMVWHEMHDFKKDTILLVLTSHPFNTKDYIRDYEIFRQKVNKV